MNRPQDEPTLPPPADPDATLAPSPAAAAPAAARAPAGYVIEKELGRGGMGVVYLARDVALDRLCALKMILSGAHAASDDAARFRTEAQAIARLGHPGIVAVYEVGEHDGRPFMALEYCPGGSLDAVLAKHPLPPKDAAVLVRALAEAVQAAHAAHVLHRDLKPANVLLTADGQAKITDFGLAKKLDEDGATRTGSVMGTPSYMPPEQAEGRKEIGPPADVYALGAILYECLAGRPPFRAATPLDTLLQVLADEPVPLRRLNPGVPADLETICHKCLQKDPAKRYASAAALADDLGRFLAGEPIAARPVGVLEHASRWVRRNPVVAALAGAVAVALAVLVAGGVWSYAEIQRGLVQVGQERDDAEAARKETATALAESRSRLVSLNVANGARHLDGGDLPTALLWFHEAFRLDALDPDRDLTDHRVRLATVGRLFPRLSRFDVLQHAPAWVAFSPGGKHFATAGATTGSVQLWDAATFAPLGPPLPDVKSPRVVFSPDGRRLAAIGDGLIHLWDVEPARPLGAPIRIGNGPVLVEQFAFSPDGDRLLAVFGFQSIRPQLKVWALGPEPKEIAVPAKADQVYDACFSPDGKRIALGVQDQANQLWRQVWVWALADDALVRIDPNGTEADKPNAVGLPRNHWPARVHFADAETLLVGNAQDFAGGEVRLWKLGTKPIERVMTIQGRLKDPSGKEPFRFVALATSPDGRFLLAAGNHENGRGPGEVQLRDLAAGTAVGTGQVFPEALRSATFHPDGRSLLTATRDGVVQAWDCATLRPLGPPLPHAGGVVVAGFSPDGRWVVTAGADRTLRRWDAVPNDDRRVEHAARELPALSADGRRLLRLRGQVVPQGDNRDLIKLELRLADALGGDDLGPALPPLSGDWPMALSADGSALALPPNRDRRTVVVYDTRTVADRGPRVALEAELTTLALSPDGRRLATAFPGRAQLWDVATGKVVRSYGHILGEPLVGFSGDGRRVFVVIAGTQGATVQVFDDADAAVREVRHPVTVTAAALDRAGGLLAVGGADGTVQVWDVATGEAVGPPIAQPTTIDRLVFSPDGRWLATVAGKGAVRVVHARTGQPILPTRTLNRAGPIAFADDRTLVATENGTTVHVIDLSPEPGRVDDLAPLTAALAQERLTPAGAVLPLSVAEQVAAWKAGRAARPEAFEASAASARIWHLRQAAVCEAGQHWFAAAFHLGQVLAADAKPEPALYLRRGRAYYRLGDWAKAEAGYGVAIDAGLDDIEVAYQRGRCRSRLGRWADAVADFDRAVALAPNDPSLRLARRLALLRLDRADAAEADYRAALTGLGLTPVTPATTRNSAGLPPAFRPGEEVRWADLVADATATLATGDDPAVLTIRGLARVRSAEGKTSLLDLARAVELDAAAWEPRRLLAQATLQRGNAQREVDAAQAALDAPQFDQQKDGRYLRGLVEVRGQRFDAALADFTAAIDAGFDGPGIRYERAALYAKQAKWQLAATDLDAGLKHAGRDAVLLGLRYEVAVRLGDWAAARDALARLLEKTPQNAWGRTYLALCVAAGDQAAYRAGCAAALERHRKKEAGVLANDLCWWCALGPDAVDDYAELLAIIEAVVARSPRAYASMNTLGALLYRAGRYEQAVEKLTESVRLQGRGGQAGDWLFLAMAHHRLGQADKAAEAMAKGRDLLKASPPVIPAGTGPLTDRWTTPLQMDVLRREAEALLAKAMDPNGAGGPP